MRKIEFCKHNVDEDDIQAVNSVLRSLFLTTGDRVEEFESAFSGYTGRAFTVGLTSCTAALHLSLLALDIGPGDEVITTPMSFCAAANAILHVGARPVFVDVEEGTGNINAELIEAAVTGKTKAVVPVHLYGQMCDMKRIHSIASSRGLKVIEDAAHAVEARRDGIGAGELADTSCYSFYATKNITSGEGGAVCTDDEGLAKRMRILRLHGIDKSTADRHTGSSVHYDVTELGWKYNMDNIQAALLLGQLARIEGLFEKRRQLWQFYEEELHGIDGLTVTKMLPGVKHAMHLFTVHVHPDRREDLISALQERGIGVAVHFRPVHLFSYYRKTFGYAGGDFPVAERFGSSTISLPFYPSLSEDDARYVASSIREIMM